jgi:hypothetical protein
MNDAMNEGTIGEMWHWMKKLAKRHKTGIRHAVRPRGQDGHLIEGT